MTLVNTTSPKISVLDVSIRLSLESYKETDAPLTNVSDESFTLFEFSSKYILIITVPELKESAGEPCVELPPRGVLDVVNDDDSCVGADPLTELVGISPLVVLP